MKPLVTFLITESQSLQIMIDDKNKINVYGYDSDQLHVFDEVEVRFIQGDTTIILAKDIVREIVATFAVAMKKAINHELLLNASLCVGRLGYFFSKKVYMDTDECEKKEDIFPQYWVWSSPDNIQTWLYSLNNKVYLEISQTYPWIFSDPEENELFISFDEYIKDYKPIVLIELQEHCMRSWINQCQDILQEMEKVS